MADPVSGPPFPWPEKFAENSAKFPVEELSKYIGQHIAWSWDGTQIVAAAPTEEGLFRLMDERGIDSQRVVLDYVFDPNVTLVGGGLCDFDSDQ